ncbi:tetratricopeptide repeat protein [Pedobacter cryoconitis]|uniref:Tetratricopeptide (TPR) repeat protein n=1 Tax=Pedobacter cryoconitis TaxID=188932 RepID=A0A7X0J7B6_9SPHI|nr:tetratricopeptide repeat protein [Pedobacter cryoconitis]MBB6501622.1 tetratricopeptide (TPR) repeat protein [Pedobacter cryoconitis]
MLVYSPEEEEVFFDQIDQVYTLTESQNLEEAEALLLKIDSSIPHPKENCSVGSILLDSIFSFYEQTGKVEKALPHFLKETEYLQEKMKTGIVKSSGHFITTGSIYYVLGDLDKARVYFKIAHSLGKNSIFHDFNADFLHMAVVSDTEFEEFKRNFVLAENLPQEELTDEQQDQMEEYCDQGNLEMDAENFEKAAEWFQKALDVLPEPKEDWEAAGWVSASCGDAYFNAGKYKEALEQLLLAHEIYSSEEDVNPFVLLRLGETYFELGDHENAKKNLLTAYQMEGADLFEDDKKYLNYLKTQHKL